MKRCLTLMVIPHNDDHVREFNLAAPILWIIGLLLVLFIVTASYFAYGYYARQGAEMEFAHLKTENEALETHLISLRTRMRGLLDRVSNLKQSDTRMRAFARLPEPTTDSGEYAPPEDPRPYALYSPDQFASLEQLSREANRLAEGYESLLQALTEGGDARRYIPSIFPVKGEGWYSSTFGYRTDPITGQRSFNKGIDIAGRKGTPIVATADGRVDAARYHQRLGYTVSIDHGNGLRTVYAHMDRKDAVKPGEQVSRGDTIGRMSNTGRTTAVHLHYAVILNNHAQNPIDYILENRQRRTLF
ncbi:MAG: hypothetical protein CME21_04575 [Gemmatimonadetes bacterium]|nr:hypothetical protein [Gemmatimonadota bacterium]